MQTPGIAHDQHLLFTQHQAVEAGWTEGQLNRALAAGRLTALAPGVYAETAGIGQLDPRQHHLLRARAFVVANGDKWHLARRTAAVLHGLPLLGEAPYEVQLTRAPTGRSQSTSRHRRVHALPASHAEVVDDLPCTSVARTVCDLARAESFRSGVVLADAALRSGLPRQSLLEVLDRCRRWPGVRRARQVAMFADGRAESPLESLARVACLEEDLPLFEPQVEVWVHGRRLGRVDGLWWDELVVFEGDGASKFEGAGVLPALLTRQEGLREAGLPVVRGFWKDLTRRRALWVQGVRRELAENPGRLAPWVELRRTGVRPTPLDRSDHYRWPALPFATRRQDPATGVPERRVA